MSWKTLGPVAPAELAEARHHAHWAAQLIAAAGETHLEHLPDTSHTAMAWDDAQQALVGHPIETGRAAIRLGLVLPTLTLRALDEDGGVLAERELGGLAVAEAYDQAAQLLAAAGGEAIGRELSHPGYDMPAHRLGEGARFEVNAVALGELSCWYANGSAKLDALARREAATDVLCWPHHFDIATLILEDRDADGAASRTIGVGLSPGDEAIDEPYWYVNHWPAREHPKLGALAAGRWQTEGFLAAVLDGSELVRARDQEHTLDSFLDSAVAATRALLA